MRSPAWIPPCTILPIHSLSDLSPSIRSVVSSVSFAGETSSPSRKSTSSQAIRNDPHQLPKRSHLNEGKLVKSPPRISRVKWPQVFEAYALRITARDVEAREVSQGQVRTRRYLFSKSQFEPSASHHWLSSRVTWGVIDSGRNSSQGRVVEAFQRSMHGKKACITNTRTLGNRFFFVISFPIPPQGKSDPAQRDTP